MKTSRELFFGSIDLFCVLGNLW